MWTLAVLNRAFVFYCFLLLLCFFPSWISIEYFLFLIPFIFGSLFYSHAFLIRIETIAYLFFVPASFLCFFCLLSLSWFCFLSLYILDLMYSDSCFYLAFYILSLQLFSFFFFPLFLFPFFALPLSNVILLGFKRW